ncbi:MAG: tetratricopeptide repeat protein [Pseudomonadota bacterium]
MVDYANEEEQIEAIKKWWNEKGKNLVLITIAAAAVLMAYKAWNSKKVAHAEDASTVYLKVQEQASNNHPVDELVKQLQAEYPKTTYAQLGSLVLGKQAVNNNKLDKAVTQLTWAKDNGSDKSVRVVAALRAARVLFAQEKYDDVLKLVNKHKHGVYGAQFQELQGDVFVKQNKLKEAKEIYTKVSEQAQGDGSTFRLLELKLNNITI